MPNIIGNNIRPWVANQIKARQKVHGSGTPSEFRTMDNLSYLNS